MKLSPNQIIALKILLVFTSPLWVWGWLLYRAWKYFNPSQIKSEPKTQSISTKETPFSCGVLQGLPSDLQAHVGRFLTFGELHRLKETSKSLSQDPQDPQKEAPFILKARPRAAYNTMLNLKAMQDKLSQEANEFRERNRGTEKLQKSIKAYGEKEVLLRVDHRDKQKRGIGKLLPYSEEYCRAIYHASPLPVQPFYEKAGPSPHHFSMGMLPLFAEEEIKKLAGANKQTETFGEFLISTYTCESSPPPSEDLVKDDEETDSDSIHLSPASVSV